MIHRYLIMIYYSLIDLGLGEICPLHIEELYFCIISMIISAFVFSKLFGEILSVYGLITQESIFRQGVLDQMNEVMTVINLNHDSILAIHDYSKKTGPS